VDLPTTGRIVTDLVIARRLRTAQLKAVERRLASHRRTVHPPCIQLPGEHCHGRIVAQFVVIVDILVAKRDPEEHPLPHQRLNAMLDQFLAAAIMEAGREPFAQSNDLVRLPQQKRTSVRCDRPAIKTSHNVAAGRQVRIQTGPGYTLSACLGRSRRRSREAASTGPRSDCCCGHQHEDRKALGLTIPLSLLDPCRRGDRIARCR